MRTLKNALDDLGGWGVVVVVVAGRAFSANVGQGNHYSISTNAHEHTLPRRHKRGLSVAPSSACLFNTMHTIMNIYCMFYMSVSSLLSLFLSLSLSLSPLILFRAPRASSERSVFHIYSTTNPERPTHTQTHAQNAPRLTRETTTVFRVCRACVLCVFTTTVLMALEASAHAAR